MISNRSKEYDIQFETYIHREEVEIPIDCTCTYYSGSHQDDDPSELIVESCVVAEDNEPYVKGQKIKLTEEEERDVEYKYLKMHENN